MGVIRTQSYEHTRFNISTYDILRKSQKININRILIHLEKNITNFNDVYANVIIDKKHLEQTYHIKNLTVISSNVIFTLFDIAFINEPNLTRS